MDDAQADAGAEHYEEAIRYACAFAGKERGQLTPDDLRAASHQATHEGLHDVHRALANLTVFPALRDRYLAPGEDAAKP